MPYLVTDKSGDGYRVHAPRYHSMRLEPELQAYRTSERGASSALRFAWEVAVPMLVSEDYQRLRLAWRERKGVLPAPAVADERMLRWAYEELRQLAHEQGAEFAVLVIGGPTEPEELRFLHKLPGTLVVNGEKQLYERLDAQHYDAYFAAYGHWGGDPPRLVDQHPNAHAHALLAEWTANALEASRD